MSQDESWSGKLIPVTYIGDLENKCKELYKNSNQNMKDVPTFYKTYIEAIQCEDLDYIIINDNIFKIINNKINRYTTHITKNKDGTYNFTSSFYNGGTSLNECLEEEMKKKFLLKHKI